MKIIIFCLRYFSFRRKTSCIEGALVCLFFLAYFEYVKFDGGNFIRRGSKHGVEVVDTKR